MALGRSFPACVPTRAPIWHPSPNCNARRDDLRPGLVVIHYTAMQSAEAALERLCDASAEVSAHYLIGGDGTLWQMVEEDQRAWHAGAGEWCGQSDINSRSIGVELANCGDHPFSEPQMLRLESLISDIMQRWHIPPEGVIGHSDMAPGRKSDPGARFDWARLERQGLARNWGRSGAVGGGGLMEPEMLTTERFRAYARDIGYSAPVDDETLLAAVRLRYRPQARGPLCAADFAPLAQAELWG